MAADVSTSYEPCSKELNGLAQQLAWVVINKRLFHRKHEKWHYILNGRRNALVLTRWFYRHYFYAGYCEFSRYFTRETVILMIVISLLMRAHSEDDLDRCTKGIVTLLKKLAPSPELAGFRNELQGLLDEAKCQVRSTTSICQCVCQIVGCINNCGECTVLT